MRRWNTVADSAFSAYSGRAMSTVSGLSSDVNPSGHSSASR